MSAVLLPVTAFVLWRVFFCVKMACFCGCRRLAGKGVEKCTESDYIRDYEQYVSEASLYFGEK